ncbi:YggS family pyridoxal phosphate-dependent enzyme [Niabella yanshanensis]|uniref:Pyridoxal phosphate homeostasis protein n=1 Tax=Niabella yanshanensis TaxID=577386 RepID=A0ABZ0W704_9BACT|nr:YggS family pyridoxal phosphate-dependent enzyme [Niabella yanshanensis]WQD38976.1 YggS family pyridoxal phosphate-dependent enzyme [Niabella yanshanensis]
MITRNLQAISQRIKNACTKAGRNPHEVKILLATKTVAVDRIQLALQAGYTLIAENKVQELSHKYTALQQFHPTHHFIGHLQTNKIKDLLRYNIACIQSIDRFDLACKLHQRLQAQERTMDILIQVNTSAEESKFGVAPERTIDLVQQISNLTSLKIKGLMTIGLLSADREQARPCFRLLKQLQQQIRVVNMPNVSMSELSMGMSADLDIAIEEGATIVRIGTAVFGERNYPDSYYWNESATIQ